jgi:hypothetical protein
MPFFENAGAVSVNGGTFYDVASNHIVAHSLSDSSHGAVQDVLNVGPGGGGNINSVNVQGTYSEF